MWIGTQSGLQRYDGTRFKNYRADIRDTAALQTDWISSIFEDSKKRLWIGTDHGAPYTLNRATGKFYNYNFHAPAYNKIFGTWHFAEDRKGNIWLAGHEGFFKLDAASNQFVKWNTTLGLLKNTRTGTLTIDNNDNLWLCTTEGIGFYNTTEKRLYNRVYNPAHNPMFDIKESVSNILISGKYFWISTGNRMIYRYEITTQQLRPFTFEMLASKKLDPEVQKEIPGLVYVLQNGQIIIPLMGRGLAYYHPELESFSIVEADNTKEHSYHTKYGSESLLQDKQKNILIGNVSGINIYNPEKQLFFMQGVGNGKEKTFPKTIVNDFLEMANGDVLVGYYDVNGGIVQTDSNFAFKKHYLLKENGNVNSPVNAIWNLFVNDKGIVWGPNQKGTVLKLNPFSGKLYEDKDSFFSRGNITAIKQDNDSDTWIGYWSKGLGRINGNTHTQRFFKSFLYSDTTTPKRVHSILVDKDKIWAGTFQNGLQVFDKHTQKFTSAFTVNERNKNSISSNTILDIVRYNKDTLILATEMGINIFDTKRNLFTAITAKEGLPNNLVLGLMLDNCSNVWVVCSGSGLCKINMNNFAITTYDITDGITDEVFSGRITGLKNGKALIAASESFISFTPSAFGAAEPPANVSITGFSVFENEITVDSLLKNNKPLQLSYKENSLRIEFASLEYWAPGSIKYFYKLNGIDKDWVPADRNHAAIYNQLSNGEYVFEIKCANRDGIYCKGITRLTIIIKPPFWKTWLFILSVTILNIILIFWLIKWREKNIKTIEAEKLKVQQLNAAQYKSKLELEQIINYFSSSLIDKNTVDAVLWDVAKNLIGQLGFEDCMMYLWNADKTKMLQQAGYGAKDSIEEIKNQHFDVSPGEGVVGYVMQTKEAVLIPDTTKDDRYRVDDIARLSEITVPVIYNDELLGVIDSEHQQKDFFTQQHLHILNTIATLMGNKIKSIEAEQSLQKTKIEMLGMNEKLSEAKLEALRSQMNPHFIFNSLNAIQECILTNKVDAAYEYLSKFSKLQRMVLNNSAKEFITLTSEVEMLHLYLSLESLRFSQSFTYTITVNDNTDADEIMLPSMIIQPYVENAVWHGLRNKVGDKILSVTCEEKDGELVIIIDDNGIGRERAAIIKAQKLGSDKTESKGTVLSAQRLNILALQYKASIHLEVTDKVNDENEPLGTRVVIRLPSNIETIKL